MVETKQQATIRLGTRASALARWQANWVTEQLKNVGVNVEIVHITTSGDTQTGPIGQSGSQGVFTKEIQRALLDGEVDLAVHSLKDLPTEHVPGLSLAAVPKRANAADVLVSRVSDAWTSLPEGSRVGTGSVRRQAQLLAVRPDLKVLGIRGNVDTRLRKLDEGDYDAIVLAAAGLQRLGLADRITEVLPHEVMLPAVGQGALGLETREDDERTRAILSQLNDAATHESVIAERSLLATLRGGCSAPIGASARIRDDRLLLDAVVLSVDGSARISADGESTRSEASNLGQSVAKTLFDKGADKLLRG